MPAYLTPETDPEPTLRERAEAVRANPHTWVLLANAIERYVAEPDISFIRAASPEVVLKLLDRVDELEAALATKAKVHTRFSAEDVLQRIAFLEQRAEAHDRRDNEHEVRMGELKRWVERILEAREGVRPVGQPAAAGFAQPGGGNYYVQRQARHDAEQAELKARLDAEAEGRRPSVIDLLDALWREAQKFASSYPDTLGKHCAVGLRVAFTFKGADVSREGWELVALGDDDPNPPHAVPADINAPRAVPLLPDYWDERRALEGKPDKSRCAQDLRRALGTLGQDSRRPWKGDRVKWRINRTGNPDNDLTGVGTVAELPTDSWGVYRVECDDGETRSFDAMALTVLL